MKKQPTVANPHDVFFRRSFGRVAVAAEFFRRYLAAQIVARLDLSRVKLEDGAFVDKKLREHFSDLFFRVALKGGGEAFIFILLEHKSTPDERVALQVLRYMVQAWDRLPTPLPLIIPVVVYHGARPWRVAKRFSNMFAALVRETYWRRYLPNFEYYLCDLSRLRATELAGAEGLSPVLKLLKYIFRPELLAQLPSIFRQTAEDLPERLAEEQLETSVRYVLESRRATPAQIKDAFMQAASEGGRMPHFLEIIYPERFQHVRQEAAADLTLRQLRRQVGKLTRALETQIRALSLNKLTQLGEALLDFESRDDLEKWLRRHAATPTRKQARA